MESSIPSRENLTVEFKSDLKKYSDADIFEAVVAFANTEGGDLYLGIEDNGLITGVNAAHSNPISLGAFIANNTVPPVAVRADVIEEQDKKIVKISVAKAYNGVIATSSGKMLRRRIMANGMPENVPMYPNEITTRLSDLRKLDYSALPVMEANLQDFDSVEIDRLHKLLLAYDGDRSLLELSNEELFKALGLVRDVNGVMYPTIAGILFLGKIDAIKRIIPTHSVTVQVLEGTSVRVNEDFCLPVLAAIEKINAYLEARNPEQELEMGIFRLRIPDFDKRAIREAVVNAFSHRDYSKMGRVRVAIDDNGLVVSNPGGFIEGINLNNLISAEPYGRNPLVSDVLKRIGLAERIGRGIDRIFEGALIWGRLLPDYSQSTSATVSLFIPRSAPDKQIAKLVTEEQQRTGRPMSLNLLFVLNALKDMPKSDITQISEAVNLSKTAVKVTIESAINKGFLEVYGSGQSRTYMLASNFYRIKEEKISYVRQKDIDKVRQPEMVVNLAKSMKFITRKDVEDLLHISRMNSYRLINALISQGVLKRENSGRYAKYSLIR